MDGWCAGQEPVLALAPGQGPGSVQQEEGLAFAPDAPAATAVEGVGTLDPAGDFAALLSRGQLDAAFSGMQKAITALVDNSMGSRSWLTAPSCTMQGEQQRSPSGPSIMAAARAGI